MESCCETVSTESLTLVGGGDDEETVEDGALSLEAFHHKFDRRPTAAASYIK